MGSVVLQSWRSKLREAEAAFKTHRLDKAANLIRAEKLVQYQPGQRLASEVALALANRAETHAERGEVETGWCDLELAQSLVGETERLTEARAVLMQFEFSQLEHLLSADDTQLALNRIDGLRRRGVGMALFGWLEKLARPGGITGVRLELRADNAEARAFYERLGFRVSGVRRAYYDGRLDALDMTRGIGAEFVPPEREMS